MFHMVPITAKYAESPPKLTHMAADIESKANDRALQYPNHRRKFENNGTNITADIATKLSYMFF